MNHAPAAVAAAITFTWLGMIAAISFLEAPLKFRAPGVTIPIGLSIGRLVFRALNAVEVVFALAVLGTVLSGRPALPVYVVLVLALGSLAAQLAAIRPRLNRRSDRVLAGENPPRSRAHLAYIAAEAVKFLALLALGVLVLI